MQPEYIDHCQPNQEVPSSIVQYVDHMGSDLTVVNSARVSFSKESTFSEFNILQEKDDKLIKYLAKHKHISPFMHPQITLRENVPIFVARQRFKHVVGYVYNEVSRRYVSDTPEFYTPITWRSAPEGSIKQGSGGKHSKSAIYEVLYKEHIERSKYLYEQMIQDGVAPEQARMVLPQSMITSYYVTGSLFAFARMYNARIDRHAQEEIRDLAVAVGKIISPLFPVSWEALTNY